MHHPGSKQQLEEVWEEQDHLSPDNFNPKTFFALHGTYRNNNSKKLLATNFQVETFHYNRIVWLINHFN